MAVLTTRLASEKYGLGVEYLRKLLRQNKLVHWGANPKYFREEELIKTIKQLEQEKKSQTENLQW